MVAISFSKIFQFPEYLTYTQARFRRVLEKSFGIPMKVFFPEVLPWCVLADERLSAEDLLELIWPRTSSFNAGVVSAGILLSFVYQYLVGYIDRGGSKAGSSGSLEYRDIYISIVLFQAAYIWIKFRDGVPRRGVYHRRNTSRYEPRIKLPKTKGACHKSERIRLGSYDTYAEAETVYQIAAFYCGKTKHTGRLHLGGGRYFPIPAVNEERSLSYTEKVKQVGDQVKKVYAEFEELKAARNLLPILPGPAVEIANGDGQVYVEGNQFLLPTSQIQQLRQPLNAAMDCAMQGQCAQRGPHTDDVFNLNDPLRLLQLLAKTQQELIDSRKQQECLKDQFAQVEIENMGLELKISQLEHEKGLSNQQIAELQSQLQTQHQEPEFDAEKFFQDATSAQEVALFGEIDIMPRSQ